MITLAKTPSEFGEIRIVESRISHSYWQGDWRQSEADRNGVSLATYVRTPTSVFWPKPPRARCS